MGGKWDNYIYNSIASEDYNPGYNHLFLRFITYYSQHDTNLELNPEIVHKPNNMRKTRLSEYSNAMHNKTVKI